MKIWNNPIVNHYGYFSQMYFDKFIWHDQILTKFKSDLSKEMMTNKKQ